MTFSPSSKRGLSALLPLISLMSAVLFLGCENDIAAANPNDSGHPMEDTDGGNADGGGIDGGDADAGSSDAGNSDGGDPDGGLNPDAGACANVCFTAYEVINEGDGGQFVDFPVCNTGAGTNGQCPQGFACTGKTTMFLNYGAVGRFAMCEPSTVPVPTQVTMDLPPASLQPTKVNVDFNFGTSASFFKAIGVHVTPFTPGRVTMETVPMGLDHVRVALAPGRYLLNAQFENPDVQSTAVYGELTVVNAGSVSLAPREYLAGTLVTFNLSLDGTPISTLQNGEAVHLTLKGAGDHILSFTPGSPASITLWLASGTYEVLTFAEGGRFPLGEVVSHSAVVVQGKSATVPIALQTAPVNGTLKFDGSSTGRSGTVYFYDRRSQLSVPAAYQNGAFQTKLYPGTYDLLLSSPVRQGGGVQRLVGESPVLENVVIPVGGKTVNAEMTSRTFTVEVRLNGQPLPNSTSNRGLVLVGADPLMLGTTGPVTAQITAFTPKRDVIVVAAPGGPLPAGQISTDFFYGTITPTMGQNIVIDLKTAQLSLEAQWNGAPPPDATARRGAFKMRQLDSPLGEYGNSFAFEAPLTGALRVQGTLYQGNWQTTFEPRTQPDTYPGLPMRIDFGTLTLASQPVTKVVSQGGRDVTLRLTENGSALQVDRGSPMGTVPVTRVGPGEFTFRAYEKAPQWYLFTCSVATDPYCGGGGVRNFLGPISF